MEGERRGEHVSDSSDQPQPNASPNAGHRARLRARLLAGGAEAFLLPDNGIKGNTHMMMFDKNNLQVADIIMKWLGEVGDRK